MGCGVIGGGRWSSAGKKLLADYQIIYSEGCKALEAKPKSELEKRVNQRDAAQGDPPVETESNMVLGSLPKEDIDKTIKSNISGIKDCYQRLLNARMLLQGTIVVRFGIDVDGSVGAVAIIKNELGFHEVECCVAEEFMQLTFPEPKGDGAVIVTYPFRFKIREK